MGGRTMGLEFLGCRAVAYGPLPQAMRKNMACIKDNAICFTFDENYLFRSWYSEWRSFCSCPVQVDVSIDSVTATLGF
jgi:hypothetical protein